MWEVLIDQSSVRRSKRMYKITNEQGKKIFDLLEALAQYDDPTQNRDFPQEMMRIALTNYQWWRYKPPYSMVEVADLRAILDLDFDRRTITLLAIMRRDENTYELIEQLWLSSQ